jgi:hypothetical protein
MYVQRTQCAVHCRGYKSKKSPTRVGVAPTRISSGDLVICKKWK